MPQRNEYSMPEPEQLDKVQCFLCKKWNKQMYQVRKDNGELDYAHKNCYFNKYPVSQEIANKGGLK